jgi:hypothetical protein
MVMANNERGAQSGSLYPLGKFGGGKLVDRGKKVKQRQPML